MLLLSGILFLVSISATAYGDCREAGDGYNLFVFAGISPGGNRLTSKAKYYPGQGNLNWTIHGLWPSNTEGEKKYHCKVPCFCNTSLDFNFSSIKDLEPRLQKLWPSLTNQSREYDSCTNYQGDEYMWCHEWLKHGTCATDNTALAYEHKYFSTILDMFESKLQYDRFVLEKHSIFPSTTRQYDSSDFANAFLEEWGVKPVLLCENPKDRGHILTSIRVCLDKSSFKPKMCPKCIFETHSCTDPFHYYPAYNN